MSDSAMVASSITDEGLQFDREVCGAGSRGSVTGGFRSLAEVNSTESYEGSQL